MADYQSHCGHCAAAAPKKMCSRCGICYCSTDCQKASWTSGVHSRLCAILQKKRSIGAFEKNGGGSHKEGGDGKEGEEETTSPRPRGGMKRPRDDDDDGAADTLYADIKKFKLDETRRVMKDEKALRDLRAREARLQMPLPPEIVLTLFTLDVRSRLSALDAIFLLDYQRAEPEAATRFTFDAATVQELFYVMFLRDFINPLLESNEYVAASYWYYAVNTLNAAKNPVNTPLVREGAIDWVWDPEYDVPESAVTDQTVNSALTPPDLDLVGEQSGSVRQILRNSLREAQRAHPAMLSNAQIHAVLQDARITSPRLLYERATVSSVRHAYATTILELHGGHPAAPVSQLSGSTFTIRNPYTASGQQIVATLAPQDPSAARGEAPARLRLFWEDAGDSGGTDAIAVHPLLRMVVNDIDSENIIDSGIPNLFHDQVLAGKDYLLFLQVFFLAYSDKLPTVIVGSPLAALLDPVKMRQHATPGAALPFYKLTADARPSSVSGQNADHIFVTKVYEYDPVSERQIAVRLIPLFGALLQTREINMRNLAELITMRNDRILDPRVYAEASVSAWSLFKTLSATEALSYPNVWDNAQLIARSVPNLGFQDMLTSRKKMWCNMTEDRILLESALRSGDGEADELLIPYDGYEVFQPLDVPYKEFVSQTFERYLRHWYPRDEEGGETADAYRDRLRMIAREPQAVSEFLKDEYIIRVPLRNRTLTESELQLRNSLMRNAVRNMDGVKALIEVLEGKRSA